MPSAKIIRHIARVSLGALAGAGLLFGAVVPAVADTPHPPVQPTSTVTSPDTADVADPGNSHLRELRRDLRFLRMINTARAHPELYPPHGNAQGATMTGCATPLEFSAALRRTAREHNTYLASRPIEWVNTYPNMHMGSDGKLAWAADGPIDRAGYHSYRAEIVATGFPTDEAALRFWMQDDAASNWGHRNLILNCTIKDAGPGQFHGGPGHHYWTVNMGNR